RGERFLLQGGDCAESFADCTAHAIETKLKILLKMSLVLTWGGRVPIVRIGRMAGQYAKPRSRPTEFVDGVEVPSYRGDHVNGFDVGDREPDPDRLVQAYFHAAATLNYARALVDGGLADLHHPDHWDLGFVQSDGLRAQYAAVRDRMLDALNFLDATGGGGSERLRRVDLFASHEGLLLAYEEAMTEASGDHWYDLSGHLLWIGNRTRQLDGAHVEFFRGVRNPLGIKVGPGMTGPELLDLLDAVEPDDAPGRILLISRFGADRVGAELPDLVEAVKASGRTVTWSCDPMHGNTAKTDTGLKTRPFDRIVAELQGALRAHDAAGTMLGGVHLELTGDPVTECVGGASELSEADLPERYQTFCDPRLNHDQSLELAFLLAAHLADRRADAST
ncbi:MAG: 3-deoxy-7-phosphoheptulonate synthase class II, partial [Myxococcota bacterium]